LSRRTTTKKVRKAATLDLDTVRVGIYVRRSTDDEHQPFSKEAQFTRLDSYVASQPGWTIVKRFEDDASGANTDRPGLQKAMGWAKSGMIDVLLVYRVDRFSRNLRDTVTLLDELDDAGVAFRSATEPFDTSTPMGRMLVQMLSMFAQFERDVIIDRVTAGLERKAAKGQWKGGRRPYGYLVDPKTHVLYPNEAEEGIIKLIFNLYTRDRIGSHTIANLLNERGHRTSTGGPWSFKQVTNILANRVYVGEINFREVTVENAHPSIIDTTQFDHANRILDERGERHGHRAASGSDYIATGRIPCPKCGKPMVGTRANGKTKTYRYYTCWNITRYGKAKCDMARLNADAVDQALTDAIASFYRSQHILIRDAVEAARRHYQSSHETVAAELKTVQADITNVTAKIDKYLDAFEADRFDPDDEDVKARLLRHRTKQRQLRDRKAQLEAQLTAEPTMPDAATLAQVNDHITDILDAGNHNQRKALVEALVMTIKILGPDRIVPVFRVPQPVNAQAEGPETGLPGPTPRVRALSTLVGRVGFEPTT
jgi:site-specific DNA recombinase